jgi:hypothetical protein
MRRFFDLMDDVTVPRRWHIGEVLRSDGSEPLLRSGVVFESEHGDQRLRSPAAAARDSRTRPLLTAELTHPGRPLDFCLTSFAVPVARQTLAEVVAGVVGADVQDIPIRVDNQLGFSVLNALRVVRCLDEDRSEFIKWTERDHRSDLAGKYRMVTQLRLDPRRIPEDAHFFRLKDWEVALIVSEQVKVAMERVGCLGAKFEEVTGASELS